MSASTAFAWGFAGGIAAVVVIVGALIAFAVYAIAPDRPEYDR